MSSHGSDSFYSSDRFLVKTAEFGANTCGSTHPESKARDSYGLVIYLGMGKIANGILSSYTNES